MLSVVLGLVAGCPASALTQAVSTARYPLPPGGRLAIENVQGNIHVEGWDRAEVQLTGMKTALSPAGAVDNVRIAVGFVDRVLTIRTVYLQESDAPVRVDYVVRVPRQVLLEELRTEEGDITVRGIEGAMNARSLNGNIFGVDITGRAIARAINGNVVVSLKDLPDRTAWLRLDTVNGNVDLILPSRPNVNLELSTVAGRIEGKYVLVASSVPGDNTRRAHLGRGGALVRLRTVRGNIRLAEREDVF